jgi:hypothetical protein
MVDVAIPLRLVTTTTLTGVLVGITVVDDIDKPGTVAEMTMPTVSHSFCANIKAPSSFVRGYVVKDTGNPPDEPSWSEASHCAVM